MGNLIGSTESHATDAQRCVPHFAQRKTEGETETGRERDVERVQER